jgi:spermidine synthase
MIASWEELARVRSAAGDELILRRRGGIYEIRCNGYDLMSNRAHRSEEALAELALETVAASAPRILIGGLGMGYTLRAALDHAPADARITVAEILPAIVAWNGDVLASLAGRPLEDPRVDLRESDIDALLDGIAGFDAILLDVDNGPAAVVHAGNDPLYSARGLRRLRRALAPGGVLAVWSADRAPFFEALLEDADLAWRASEVAARGVAGDPLHVIYVARAAR